MKTYGFVILSLLFTLTGGQSVSAQDVAGSTTSVTRKIDGYKGIWFDLGQRTEFGSKYSGGLGTYTAKHHPLAVYVEAVQKTFFVFGGTTRRDERHLLAMVSYYDHQKHNVPKPTVVHDKKTVNDPHDNPSINIDDEGYIWIFVSGRGSRRPGFKYRSRKPYDIESFERISEEEFTYPQPWWVEGSGFLHLFTKYTKGRELYWNISNKEGGAWTPDRKLAGMGGHYQMSHEKDGRVITAFNMHPRGVVNKRTNLYLVQTDDRGETWKTVSGEVIKTPMVDTNCAALVRDYRKEGRLVYLKDTGFDSKGNPVLLYITSDHYRPGPQDRPRMWTLAHWTGREWAFREIIPATHNYDMGSLYIEKDGTWRIIAPTAPGPQKHGTGGEIGMWMSQDEGQHWRKTRDLTQASVNNHGYARRPVNAHPEFYAFWADGNPDEMTESHLYFTNQSGSHVWQLPYEMKEDFASPKRMESK